jgi:hypothetical protein
VEPDDINELVSTIRKGITEREFYLLIEYDDRLRLIVGNAKGRARREKLLKDFAGKHGWSASETAEGVTFRPANR